MSKNEPKQSEELKSLHMFGTDILITDREETNGKVIYGFSTSHLQTIVSVFGSFCEANKYFVASFAIYNMGINIDSVEIKDWDIVEEAVVRFEDHVREKIQNHEQLSLLRWVLAV